MPDKTLREKCIAVLQKRANICARKHGHHRATEIRINENSTVDRIVSHIPNGYRKNTTDEYVPKAYLSNFGWKNTYYQHAVCVVELGTKNG